MSEVAAKLIEALGGQENIVEVEACITRLRLILKDPSKMNEKAVKACGAVGVMKLGSNIQVVLGTHAERIETEMKDLMK